MAGDGEPREVGYNSNIFYQPIQESFSLLLAFNTYDVILKLFPPRGIFMCKFEG